MEVSSVPLTPRRKSGGGAVFGAPRWLGLIFLIACKHAGPSRAHYQNLEVYLRGLLCLGHDPVHGADFINQLLVN